MYPYKKYSPEFDTVIYNHDSTIENEIAITVDKMIEGTLLSTDKRLIDILYQYHNNSSVECDDDIQAIITNWLNTGDYKHIHTLIECYMLVK